ncbi:MAG: hypothetical protein AAF355_14670 [Myxococcota bacterium]
MKKSRRFAWADGYASTDVLLVRWLHNGAQNTVLRAPAQGFLTPDVDRLLFHDVAFSSDGRYVLGLSSDPVRLLVWHRSSSKFEGIYEIGAPRQSSKVDMPLLRVSSKKSRVLITCGKHIWLGRLEKGIYLVEGEIESDHSISAIDLSYNGRYAAFGSDQGHLIEMDLANPRKTQLCFSLAHRRARRVAAVSYSREADALIAAFQILSKRSPGTVLKRWCRDGDDLLKKADPMATAHTDHALQADSRHPRLVLPQILHPTELTLLDATRIAFLDASHAVQCYSLKSNDRVSQSLMRSARNAPKHTMHSIAVYWSGIQAFLLGCDRQGVVFRWPLVYGFG